MSFPFTPTIPSASQTLAASQPLIQQNFNSTQTILAVDHVTFDNATGGQHKQTTFPGLASPTTPTLQASVAYPAAGIADPGIPQYFFRNSLSPYPLSAVAAFCVFQGTGSTTNPSIPVLNGFNIATIASIGPNYTVTLTPGATTGNNVAVFISTSNGGLPSYNFLAGVLTFAYPSAGTVSILILQI
jgi:hypothetical protein